MQKKHLKKLSLAERLILIANAIAAGLLLFSYVAPYSNPQRLGIIAILGLAYQHFIIINIAFIIYWLIRWKLYALISFICIVVGFKFILLNFRLGSPVITNSQKRAGVIKLLTYNINRFNGYGTIDSGASRRGIIDLIKHEQPDIAAFEDYKVIRREKGRIVNALKKAMSTNFYYFNSVYNKRSRDSSGNVIFSKYPIINAGPVLASGTFAAPAIFADIRLPKKVIRVYCVHLESIHIRNKKDYINGKIDLAKTNAIENGLISAFVIRSQQAALLKQHMDSSPYPYILIGDFNDTPISFVVTELSKGLKNAFVEKGSGFGVTYHSWFPKLQIDYILVKPQFQIHSFNIIKNDFSDHYAITTDLSIN
jgi:endonuclease/exonuclease/phosphatase family metal-dependent hydrolase